MNIDFNFFLTLYKANKKYFFVENRVFFIDFVFSLLFYREKKEKINLQKSRKLISVCFVHEIIFV